MTNSQAADHDNWLVRCSPCALGFSQSNYHNYIQGLEEEYWEGGTKDFFKGEIKEGGEDYLKMGGEGAGGDKYPLRTIIKFWR